MSGLGTVVEGTYGGSCVGSLAQNGSGTNTVIY